ncbi:hypothetical protein V9L05_01290 [Bernardetia sp. Wsw4-3y2]|uniref:hypothetical protein n=1 Tax=Bernardetia sp. Wsw4-3y2 TaxID=3127471 RepID=UPI0030CEEA10
MELEEFLEKWGIKKTNLSLKLGLSSGGLYNKLSKDNADKLTDNQKITLLKLLKEEMKKDIENLKI